jgi:Flp pilus assembly protein TadD
MLNKFLAMGPIARNLLCAACAVFAIEKSVAQTIELDLPEAGRQDIELSRPELKRAQALLDAARNKRQNKDFSGAMADTDRALLLLPRDLPARYLRAILLADTAKTTQAHKAFEELTQEFPELPEPHNNLAVQQALMGDLELARQSLLRALAIFPDYVVARENLGDVYLRMAQAAYQGAVKSTAQQKPVGVASEALKNKLKMTTEWLQK